MNDTKLILTQIAQGNIHVLMNCDRNECRIIVNSGDKDI